MSNRYLFLIGMLYWIGMSVLSAQEVNHQFQYLTIDEGLAHTDATCLTQDDQNFIWIGTYFGLNRFDGYELKSFYNQNNPLRNVYTNRINDFCIDNKRRIWLATQGGVECFDIATATFLELKRDNTSSLATSVAHIAFDQKSDRLILGNATDISFFEVSEALELKKIETSLPANIGLVHEIMYKDGDWWLLGARGLFKVDLGDSKIQLEPIQLLVDDQEANDFIGFTIDQGELWLASQEAIYSGVIAKEKPSVKLKKMPFATDSFTGKLEATNFTSTRLVKEGENLWFGTTSGLVHCQITEEGLLPKWYQKKEPFTKYSLTSSHVSDLFMDQSNCLWVSTFGGGVNYIDLSQKKFHLLQSDPQNPENSLSGNYIRAMLEDADGQLWIGTRENGLNVYDFDHKRFKHFLHQNDAPSSISSNKIRSIAADQEDRIWIGTQEGLNIYEAGQSGFQKLFHERDNPNSLTNDVIFALACDKFGQMWAGSWHNGLNRIVYQDQNNYQIERITSQTAPWKLSSDKVSFIYADEKSDEVFVGTDNGLNHILLTRTGQIAKIIHYKGSGETNQLRSNFIWPIVKTSPNVLWVGTIGGGLNKLELFADGTYTSRQYSVAEGAPSRDIESIQVDQAGNLWLGTRGLSMFNPVTESFTNYDINDGLQSNSFKIGAAATGSNGRLYFGGTNGINYFDPGEIQQYEQKPKIVITDLIVNNEPVQLRVAKNQWTLLEKSINLTERIRLSHLENNFSLSFASLHFANPDKCQYRYKLDGYNEDWVYTDAKDRKATYSNLEYGQYTFHVAGSNSDGIWSEEIATLEIAIIAPWWWTTMAKIIYVLLILGVIASIFYYFTRWYKLKKVYEFTLLGEQQMADLHKMRLQFFTNISHEFKTPLTLILNPLEQLIKGEVSSRKQRRYYQVMQNNAKRLLNLVNELLEFRKIESGSYALHAEKADLSAFAEDIFENFREHALLRDIDFSFQSAGLTDNFWMDKNVVEKILVNLLGNAFKYTGVGGNIKLSILENDRKPRPTYSASHELPSDHTADDYLWISVVDNGAGIPSKSLSQIFDRYFRGEEFPHDEKKGTGVGLALVKSLVARHSGILRVSSQDGAGTEFLVGLPKGNAHLSPDEISTQVIYKKADYDLPKLKDLYPETYIDSPQETLNETKKPTLLVVEDNLELRQFLKEHFEGAFYILEANNGVEGLEILATHQPDIILSDVMMPQMDGIRFCKAVKGNESLNHIPFILLTAKAAMESRLEGIKSGADIYLAKPFSIEELQLTLQRIITSRQKLRKLYLENAFSEAREIAVVEKEKDFVASIVRLIEENMENNQFDVSMLCKKMGMSRTKLYGKAKAVTGKSVGELIRSLRLRKAAELLASEDISVVQAMYRVGIQSQSYFTKSFKKEFGKTPSRYIKEL